MTNTKQTTTVYLAAPFFNDVEVERMQYVAGVLRSRGFDVFVPFENQLAGLEFASKPWRDAVFANDVMNIHKADLVVGIYDGEDAGTMWELGFAFANRIPSVVFSEDTRCLNLMITDSLHAFIDSREKLESYDFDKLEKIRYEGPMR